jgi:hypothetical protein
MKPTLLKPGEEIRCSGVQHTLVFVKRLPSDRSGSGKAVNIFRCEACRGLNGPDDEGFVQMSDYQVSRRCARAARGAEAGTEGRQA